MWILELYPTEFSCILPIPYMKYSCQMSNSVKMAKIRNIKTLITWILKSHSERNIQVLNFDKKILFHIPVFCRQGV